jgi:hypothetical protein
MPFVQHFSNCTWLIWHDSTWNMLVLDSYCADRTWFARLFEKVFLSPSSQMTG